MRYVYKARNTAEFSLSVCRNYWIDFDLTNNLWIEVIFVYIGLLLLVPSVKIKTTFGFKGPRTKSGAVRSWNDIKLRNLQIFDKIW